MSHPCPIVRLCYFALAAVVLPATAQDGGEGGLDAGGFRPLFDGRTLDGWTNVNCAPATWSVREGMIHCTGIPTGELRTARQYENFVLELEWRHLEPGGNAGVFVWAGPISAPGRPFLRAIEVQVLENAYGNTANHTTHGDIFPIHGSTMVPVPPSRGSRSFPSEHRSKPSPEWNHYRIECRNGTVRLAVNGKVVSGGSDCNYRKGYIALESEGGVVDYRNLRIKELPPTGADATNSAPLAQGHRPLYSGADLSGWKAAGDHQQAWKPSDWRLVYDPAGASSPDTGHAASLASLQRFGDCEIICDWRWPDGAPEAAGLVPVEGAALSVPPRMDDPGQPGEWHRLVARIEGGKLTLEVDGRDLPKPPGPEPGSPGPLVLRPGGVRTEFASIYVRALDGT